MATTADKSEEQSEDKPVTEEDLRSDKYGEEGVESESSDESSETEASESESEEEADGEDEEQIQDNAEEEEQSESTTFTKKFPQYQGETPEEYAKNLEKALENSTAEFHRLRQEQATKPKESEDETEAPPVPSDLASLFVKQEMDRKIVNDWKEFSPHYPQVSDAAEYDRFTKRVSVLSQTIMSEEGRLAEPRELYAAAAASLGWEKSTQVTDEDRLGDKLKESASVTKTNSSTKRTLKSKVTDEMIAFNRKLYPEKSDSEIRKELEEHVQ